MSERYRSVRVILLVLQPLSRTPEALAWLQIAAGLLVLFLPAIGATAIAKLTGLVASIPVGIVLLALMLVILCFHAAYRLQMDIDEHQARPKPALAFGEPYVDQRFLSSVTPMPNQPISSTVATNYIPETWTTGTSRPIYHPSPFTSSERIEPTEDTGNTYFAHVPISNNPPIRSERAAATQVIARIAFFRPNTERSLVDVIGRWSETEQPATRSPYASIADLRRMDFPPNGEPHDLDIALKHPQDDCCYGFDDESCRLPGWRKDAFKLDGELFDVCVTLQGVGMDGDVVEWFTLRNLASGGGMSIHRGVPRAMQTLSEE